MSASWSMRLRHAWQLPHRCLVLPLALGAWLLAAEADAADAAAIARGAAGPRRVYGATRLVGPPPDIDGRLDESCWSNQGTWAGEYTQYTPAHGAAPSERSELKVLYDDRNLYVAIRAFDAHPALMTRFAGPRDTFTGDIVGITFDSYFDHRTGYEFDLTAAGQKIDLTLFNDSWDTTWNPIWYGKVSHDEQGWYAEMQIPLSQLRYNDRHPQVWGLHSWRWLARNSEESQWKLLANDGTGLVYSFGELQGLELPPPRRHVELTPYTSAKLTTRSAALDGNRTEQEVAGGVDAKYQLSSSFTLDATVNPDFGQVESDPSEINLTAFETFLTERRPFFIEGKDILQFSFDDDEPLFYSRRIGHVPSLAAPDGARDVPASTTILGAWKITGKSAAGLSLGVLHAATAEEHARIDTPTGAQTVSIEPATQYVIVRALQELDHGQTTLGGFGSAAVRAPASAALRDLLPRQALVGALDFECYWNDRTYSFTAKAVGTHITGTPAAIARLQTASARYFQRPDAQYVTFDPTRRTLDGWGAYLMAGKRSKGHWRYHEKLTAYSPGVEFNDLGYLREADRVMQHTEFAYVEKEPARFYRDFQLGLEHHKSWNFGHEPLRSELVARAASTLRNKVSVEFEAGYVGEALDPVALRGGPALRVPPQFEYSAYASTDGERRWVGSLYFEQSVSTPGADRHWELAPSLKFRPNASFTLSLGAQFNHEDEDRHFVAAGTTAAGTGGIVSALRSESVTYTVRAQWFIRPELSIQYYGSPFGSSGTYSRFARVIAPRASSYVNRTTLLPTPRSVAGAYAFDENGDDQPELTLRRPDFSFGQFRSNLVLRWEFRPGSNLYVVWAQERSHFTDAANGAAASVGDLTRAPATNVFLLKCSYWFSL